MSLIQVSRHCTQCGHQTLHSKERMSTGMAVLLTIFTAGSFAILWLPYRWILIPLRKYRCQTCGHGRR